MNLDKQTLKKLRGLIVFTILLFLGIQHIDVVLNAVRLLLRLVFPFLLGGCMAFIINVPMSALEQLLFARAEKTAAKGGKAAGLLVRVKRPASLVLTLVLIVLVLNLVIFTVVPEVASTIAVLSQRLPDFFEQLSETARRTFEEYPEIVDQLSAMEISGEQIMNSVTAFLQSGVTSTFNVAMGIANGVMNFFIGLVFAIYILARKEAFGRQAMLLLQAFFTDKVVRAVHDIGSLTYKTFANFLSGQCIEAVILGLMFFISLSIFGFPYAMLIGVLIAFTALIPIFGAFIGCVVGAFLILMVNPVQALYFIILFLVLQQVEGNFIYPYVVGNSVGLPSIWVLVAVTVGGSAMGIVGMVIFIPMVSVLYALLRGYVYQRIEQKDAARPAVKEKESEAAKEEDGAC